MSLIKAVLRNNLTDEEHDLLKILRTKGADARITFGRATYDNAPNVPVPQTLSAVSKQHAELYLDGDSFCIIDISRYGTQIRTGGVSTQTVKLLSPTPYRLVSGEQIILADSISFTYSEVRE